MIITQTPLRISLGGGGTDLPAYYRRKAGCVLSTAIDKYVYVILNQRFDSKIYISYSRKEIVDSVDEIQHELVREAMRKTGVEKGVEIALMADIPSEGSGLGSSSSITVGLLNAFYSYRGVMVTAERLAREACEIEIRICGKPIGKQDQYIAAYGGLKFFEFRPDETVEVCELPLERQRQELGSRLFLFYTGVTRKADAILREQSDNTAARQQYLDGIRQLAFDAKDAILICDYDRIGNVLSENWRLKKELACGVTSADIDAMVDRALRGGALGCKISGAGGGGFLLAYCQPEKQNALIAAMKGYRAVPFFLERYGSKVIFNVDTYEWK